MTHSGTIYMKLGVPVSGVILTHWGRVTHICVGNLTIIGPDNSLSPGRRQAIIWTNAGILLIGPWVTNFSEILIGIHTFSFNKLHLKTSSAKWRIFCLGLNVLKESLITRLCVGDHRHWVLDALDTDRTGITGLGVWLPLMLMGVVHTRSVIYVQKTVETAIDFMHDVELGADGSILHMAVGRGCWWPGVTR